MSTLFRLTPKTLGDILETEDKANACFDDDMRVIGVELPLPDGMVDNKGCGTQTALYGDRVGKDKYGHWIVVADRPADAAYRVLVTGSRDWTDEALIRDQLARVRYEAGRSIVVVHGGCPTGADAMAAEWIEDWGATGGSRDEAHPADWDHCTDACPQGHRKSKKPGDTVHPGVCDDYCPSAGPRRNRELVTRGADICLAFIKNGSRGASHTAQLAAQAGIPVRRWDA